MRAVCRNCHAWAGANWDLPPRLGSVGGQCRVHATPTAHDDTCDQFQAKANPPDAFDTEALGREMSRFVENHVRVGHGD